MKKNLKMNKTANRSDIDNSQSATPIPEKKQLYSHYEDKTEEVKKQFVILKENQYISRLKNVYSASNEFMTCDCNEEIIDGVNHACGPDSDCINRLTNIECVNGQCDCGESCQNQRFQRREYADISVFLTEKKGYGVRANVDIPANTFIIEYMGDIIDSIEYKSRKEKYDAEGIKHFYFMMIQDNEIIDATKRASLARYCNHSCSPNAYVDKWVVNKRYRMGIFAKTDITKGEEICFDYNVDRYGAVPQTCYCGAPNCLGVMGGKTQSETVRLLPHIVTEALGVTATDEKKWLKEQRKSGIKVTTANVESHVNVEFVKALELKPLSVADIAKVSSCLMQPELDFIVIQRIVERLLISQGENFDEILRRFNRLHGIQALGDALQTLLDNIKSKINKAQQKLVEDVVHLLELWPVLKSKNSIRDSNLETTLVQLKDKGINSELKSRIDKLVESWSGLEIVYRIPKKSESISSRKILDERRSRSTDHMISTKLPTGPSSATKKPWVSIDASSLPSNRKLKGIPLPPGWEWATDPKNDRIYFYNRHSNVTQWNQPSWDDYTKQEEEKRKREKEREKERERIKEIRDLKYLEEKRARQREVELREQEERRNILSTIIAQASTNNDVNISGKKSNLKTNGDAKRKNVSIEENTSQRQPSPYNDWDGKKHASNERKWALLFAAYVPNVIKKYESSTGREVIKNCARDIVHLLAEKEAKRHAGENIPRELSHERKLKIKSFCKIYMEKFMIKFENKKRKIESSNPSSKKTKV